MEWECSAGWQLALVVDRNLGAVRHLQRAQDRRQRSTHFDHRQRATDLEDWRRRGWHRINRRREIHLSGQLVDRCPNPCEEQNPCDCRCPPLPPSWCIGATHNPVVADPKRALRPYASDCRPSWETAVGTETARRGFPAAVPVRIERLQIRSAIACAPGFDTSVSDLPWKMCSRSPLTLLLPVAAFNIRI